MTITAHQIVDIQTNDILGMAFGPVDTTASYVRYVQTKSVDSESFNLWIMPALSEQEQVNYEMGFGAHLWR